MQMQTGLSASSGLGPYQQLTLKPHNLSGNWAVTRGDTQFLIPGPLWTHTCTEQRDPHKANWLEMVFNERKDDNLYQTAAWLHTASPFYPPVPLFSRIHSFPNHHDPSHFPPLVSSLKVTIYTKFTTSLTRS